MEYSIKIEKKNRKSISVRATTEGIIVSAPKYMPKWQIMNVVEKNKIELDRMMLAVRNKNYENNISKREIYLFGKKITQELAEDFDTEEKIEKLYRLELEKILPSLFKKYNEITGLYENEYKVRKMKARWGTCYPERKLININLYLAKRPIKEIESVVLHELIHLKYRHHTKDFFNEVKKYMPDYDEIKIELNS